MPMPEHSSDPFPLLRPERSPRLRAIHQTENLLTVAALLAMMTLPVVEIVLRTVFKRGISGSSAIVQHLTLIVGMMGGAIAAREGRLLALSPVQTLLKGRWKYARRFSAAVSRRDQLLPLRFERPIRAGDEAAGKDFGLWRARDGQPGQRSCSRARS